MSVNSTNPSTLFGGTWAQLKDVFLLACGDSYSAGSTGGEAEHALTTNEMPSHRHSFTYGREAGSSTGEYVTGGLGRGPRTYYTVSNSVGLSGGGDAHNNMPPYLAVYVWKRTA